MDVWAWRTSSWRLGRISSSFHTASAWRAYHLGREARHKSNWVSTAQTAAVGVGRKRGAKGRVCLLVFEECLAPAQPCTAGYKKHVATLVQGKGPFASVVRVWDSRGGLACHARELFALSTRSLPPSPPHTVVLALGLLGAMELNLRALFTLDVRARWWRAVPLSEKAGTGYASQAACAPLGPSSAGPRQHLLGHLRRGGPLEGGLICSEPPVCEFRPVTCAGARASMRSERAPSPGPTAGLMRATCT